jgi:hypothetical protein
LFQICWSIVNLLESKIMVSYRYDCLKTLHSKLPLQTFQTLIISVEMITAMLFLPVHSWISYSTGLFMYTLNLER